MPISATAHISSTVQNILYGSYEKRFIDSVFALSAFVEPAADILACMVTGDIKSSSKNGDAVFAQYVPNVIQAMVKYLATSL